MIKNLNKINVATIVSGTISVILLLVCLVFDKYFWGITLLFIAITQMLVAINQYELSTEIANKKYRRLADISMGMAVVILVVAMLL